jgi:hypothetical protein
VIVGESCVVSPPEYPCVQAPRRHVCTEPGRKVRASVGSSPSACDVTGAVANSVLLAYGHMGRTDRANQSLVVVIIGDVSSRSVSGSVRTAADQWDENRGEDIPRRGSGAPRSSGGVLTGSGRC